MSAKLITALDYLAKAGELFTIIAEAGRKALSVFTD